MISIAELFTEGIRIPDRREIWEWAHESVDFGNAEAFKGHYDVENVPWTRAILRAQKNPYVRETTAIMPPQESGKTIAGQVCLAERATNSPTKMAFNTVTNVGAKKWQETRWNQTLAATPKLKARLSPNPYHNKSGRIIFKDQTFLLIQGAETDANRQSDSVEYQTNDECHLWEKPWLTQMHSRTRAYKNTKKILNISIGGNKGTEIQERFLAGNQGEWSHHCPACGTLFQYVFDRRKPNCNIHFDMTKAVMYADGRLDMKEFEKTVYVTCQQPHCGHKMEYDEAQLERLNRNGAYVSMNPDANPEIVSLHVNAFAIGRRSWAQILEPWVRMHIKGGVFAMEILRTFICEDLAEFWEEKPMVVSKEIRLGSYTRNEVLKPKAWVKEWIRTMQVDNQRGSAGDIPHRWFTCWAFSKDGESRLVDCGRLNEWSEVRVRQLELGVPDWTPERPGPWVVVDRRYDPTEVDEVCAKYKWFGAMGSDMDEFVHSAHSPYAGKRMLFSEERQIDIGYGTIEQGRRHALYFLWSSQKIQDIYATLRDGKGPLCEVPSDIGEFCPEYAEHANSHRQIMEQTRTGHEKRVWKRIGDWADHLYDCTCQAVVLGLMAGVFKRE